MASYSIQQQINVDVLQEHIYQEQLVSHVLMEIVWHVHYQFVVHVLMDIILLVVHVELVLLIVKHVPMELLVLNVLKVIHWLLKELVCIMVKEVILQLPTAMELYWDVTQDVRFVLLVVLMLLALFAPLLCKDILLYQVPLENVHHLAYHVTEH